MNTDSMQKTKIVHLPENEFIQLTREVKETIALVKPIKKAPKLFTVAQLWNHHRNARLATHRIR